MLISFWIWPSPHVLSYIFLSVHSVTTLIRNHFITSPICRRSRYVISWIPNTLLIKHTYYSHLTRRKKIFASTSKVRDSLMHSQKVGYFANIKPYTERSSSSQSTSVCWAIRRTGQTEWPIPVSIFITQNSWNMPDTPSKHNDWYWRLWNQGIKHERVLI